MCRNASRSVISAVNFTVPVKLPMAHLAFSRDSREKRTQDWCGRRSSRSTGLCWVLNFYFFIESGYHVAQTGLKLLNLLSASTFQVLGLDLYAYHVWFYAALGQTQGFIA